MLQQALQALRGEFESAGKRSEYETLQAFLAAGGETAPSYAEVARRLGVAEADVTSRIHRLRRRYRDLILERLRASTETEEQALEELRDLFAAFA